MGVKWLVQAVISKRHPVANAGSIPATSTITNKIRIQLDNIIKIIKMKRLSIYERLKPEVKEALLANTANYESSVTSIVELLSNEYFYSNLKISDISSLYTFSDIELIKVSAWDIKYGDNILISKDYE